jgi:hypothetical protein
MDSQASLNDIQGVVQDDPKMEEILDRNAEAFNRLRDLAEELKAVVKHENRIVQDDKPDPLP